MIKFIKDYSLTIRITSTITLTLMFCVAFGNYVTSLDRIREQKCQQVCGENVVTRCDQKHNIITCDERTRVQHFPK
jgi:hypothetical protein